MDYAKPEGSRPKRSASNRTLCGVGPVQCRSPAGDAVRFALDVAEDLGPHALP